jgi:haloacetate dehalogenase
MFDRFDAADPEMRRIVCPLLVLWGDNGIIGRLYDPRAIWRDSADAVEGRAVGSGHYPAEAKPAAVLAALEPFLAG